ncbi:Uncharacterised protein [Mycobacteroides abscessus subsp. abscessus]|nr:Uncharacterised protein [Mycobacteroides abscessus subsp. abscessus]
MPKPSTIDAEVWCPSCTAPDPTRMREVAAATSAISVIGLALATATKWCSASQYR